jgi:DNA repair protein RadC
MNVDILFGPGKPKPIRFKTIKAVYETLTIREDISGYLSTGDRYTEPSPVFDTFRFLQRETKEYFIALHLDGKNRILCIDMISVGSLNQSIVHPRETLKNSLLSSAAAIILIHNHPTGDPAPSSEDISITKRLSEAGEIIGIKVLDHIIIGETFFSFTERGLM